MHTFINASVDTYGVINFSSKKRVFEPLWWHYAVWKGLTKFLLRLTCNETWGLESEQVELCA